MAIGTIERTQDADTGAVRLTISLDMLQLAMTGLCSLLATRLLQRLRA